MFGCFFGQKEKVTPEPSPEEIKKREFIEIESQRVRDQMLDIIQHPDKYKERETYVTYAGGFEVDFEPLIEAVNKHQNVSLQKAGSNLFFVKEYRMDTIDGARYYKITRDIHGHVVFYIIW